MRRRKPKKRTTDLVKHFEETQAQYGTEVAIFNLLWVQYVTQLKSLGIKRVSTTGYSK